MGNQQTAVMLRQSNNNNFQSSKHIQNEKLFSNRFSKVNQKKQVPVQTQGLPNIGNTCFLNSIIQLLVSSTNLREAILSQYDEKQSSQCQFQQNAYSHNFFYQQKRKRLTNSNLNHDEKNILEYLRKIFFKIVYGYSLEQKRKTMKKIVQYLSKNNNEYHNYSQQDSFYFLMFLLTKLFKQKRQLEQLFKINFKLICKSKRCHKNDQFQQYTLDSLQFICSNCKQSNIILFLNEPKIILFMGAAKSQLGIVRQQIYFQKKQQKPNSFFSVQSATFLVYKLKAKILYSGDGGCGHYVAVRRKINQDYQNKLFKNFEFYEFNDKFIYKIKQKTNQQLFVNRSSNFTQKVCLYEHFQQITQEQYQKRKNREYDYIRSVKLQKKRFEDQIKQKLEQQRKKYYEELKQKRLEKQQKIRQEEQRQKRKEKERLRRLEEQKQKKQEEQKRQEIQRKKRQKQQQIRIIQEYNKKKQEVKKLKKQQEQKQIKQQKQKQQNYLKKLEEQRINKEEQQKIQPNQMRKKQEEEQQKLKQINMIDKDKQRQINEQCKLNEQRQVKGDKQVSQRDKKYTQQQLHGSQNKQKLLEQLKFKNQQKSNQQKQIFLTDQTENIRVTPTNQVKIDYPLIQKNQNNCNPFSCCMSFSRWQKNSQYKPKKKIIYAYTIPISSQLIKFDGLKQKNRKVYFRFQKSFTPQGQIIKVMYLTPQKECYYLDNPLYQIQQNINLNKQHQKQLIQQVKNQEKQHQKYIANQQTFEGQNKKIIVDCARFPRCK